MAMAWQYLFVAMADILFGQCLYKFDDGNSMTMTYSVWASIKSDGCNHHSWLTDEYSYYYYS